MNIPPVIDTSLRPSSHRAVILLLAAAGGGADAVMILAFHVMTAGQTGNTILLAVAFAQGRYVDALHSLISVMAYMVGAATGELVISGGRASTSGLRRVGLALFLELAALVCLAVSWQLAGTSPGAATGGGLVALAAAGMGVQSVVVLRIHTGPKTTYVTGTLTMFMIGLVLRLRPIGPAGPLTPALYDKSANVWMYGGTWLVYALGALAGGVLYISVGAAAVILPIVALLVVLIVFARLVRARGRTPRTELGNETKA